MKSGASIVCAIALRPSLWLVAISQLFRLVPRGWWRRSPYLPIPSQSYIRFRKQTRMGGKGFGIMAADDGVTVDELLKIIAFVRSNSKDLTGNE